MKQKWPEFDAKLNYVADVDWARLAAFIDGEGTISINESGKPRKAHWTPRISLQVMVTGTSVALMNWLQSTFGGTVYSVKANGFGKRPIWRWQLNEKQAESILSRCRSFIIIKKEQANVALEFRALKSLGVRGKVVDQAIVEKRKQYASKIREFNNLTSDERPHSVV